MIWTIIYLVALTLGGIVIGFLICKRGTKIDETTLWSDGYDQGYRQGYDDGYIANIKQSIEV